MRLLPGHIVVAGVIVVLLNACNTVSKQEANISGEPGWEKIGPGGGGATFIPAFSYQRADNFLIRCDMTGAYLTKDGGQSYQQINFPNGSSGFAFDPKDSNTIYIGSKTLNQSTDGGKTWQVIFPKKEEITKEIYTGDHAEYEIKVAKGSIYENGSVENIKVDPVESNSLYFSTGNFFFHSTDGGNSWKKEDCKSRIEFIYTNDKKQKEEVFIFTAASQCTFNKKSGTITTRPLPPAMSPAFSFTGGVDAKTKTELFYALHHDTAQETDGEFGHSEVWTSADNGNTWQRIINTVVTNDAVGIKPSYSMIACAELDAAQAYLVTNRYEEKKRNGFVYWYGAIKTNDAGNNWEWVWKGGGGSGQYGVKDGIGAANLEDAWSEKAFGGEYIRLMDVGVDPNDGNTAIVTDWYRTMKTIDGGKTWKQVYSKPQTDGTFISNGMDVTTAYGVHFDPFDSNHIAISYTDIGYHHSYNRGKSWVRSTTGVPVEWINTCYWVVFDPEVKSRVWSAWSGMHDFPRGKMTRNPKWKDNARGGICVSGDGGKTWKPSIEGMGSDAPATSIIMDSKSKAGTRVLYVSVYNKGVFKSIDDGKTWALKNKGIEANTCAFELMQTSKGDLFLTVSATPMHKDGKKGKEFYSGAVYKSTNGAETWTKLNVTSGLLFPNGIEYDRSNPDRLFLACWADIDLSDLVGGDVAKSTGGNEVLKMPGGIFISEDGGNTWKQSFDEKQYIYDVTADPFHAGRFYAVTFNRTAYRSDDSGKSWKKIKGYDFHWGQRPVIDQNDPEKIYITTFGSSVWHGVPVTE